jgi:hypothetical protein
VCELTLTFTKRIIYTSTVTLTLAAAAAVVGWMRLVGTGGKPLVLIGRKKIYM